MNNSIQLDDSEMASLSGGIVRRYDDIYSEFGGIFSTWGDKPYVTTNPYVRQDALL